MKMQVPHELLELSRNAKIIWYGQIISKDPWKNITGKLEAGRKIDIEKILDEKGFEYASEYF
jgi:hypothetical protein